MARRSSGWPAWLRGIVVLAAIVAVASSPRLQSRLIDGVCQLLSLVAGAINNLEARLRPRLGRQMAALHELSQTLDAATTQLESSMVVSKVSAALAQEPRLRGRRVGVRIIGGILHLEGEVASAEEKELAGEVARRASGAELVANDLKVVARAG